MFALPLLSLLLATPAALAAPNAKRASCDISKAGMTFPAGQTALAQPSYSPSYIAIAIGTQNYTCSSAGTYTNVGAVAELFDISCLYNTPAFSTIQDTAIAVWKSVPSFVTPSQIISLLHAAKTPEILGQHYYVTNPITGAGVSPKWDFTSQGATAGNANAYVVAAKVGDLPAPTGSSDVDWVSLNAVQGALANQVYRLNTRGGQPPSSCTVGSAPITVKYAAQYWLFGGSVQK